MEREQYQQQAQAEREAGATVRYNKQDHKVVFVTLSSGQGFFFAGEQTLPDLSEARAAGVCFEDALICYALEQERKKAGLTAV